MEDPNTLTDSCSDIGDRGECDHLCVCTLSRLSYKVFLLSSTLLYYTVPTRDFYAIYLHVYKLDVFTCQEDTFINRTTLIYSICFFTQVSQAEDVGSMGAVEMLDEEQLYNFSDISSVLGKSRHQIMAAQFECYLKIIHDPPRTEEGDKTVAIVPLALYSQFS